MVFYFGVSGTSCRDFLAAFFWSRNQNSLAQGHVNSGLFGGGGTHKLWDLQQVAPLTELLSFNQLDGAVGLDNGYFQLWCFVSKDSACIFLLGSWVFPIFMPWCCTLNWDSSLTAWKDLVQSTYLSSHFENSIFELDIHPPPRLPWARWRIRSDILHSYSFGHAYPNTHILPRNILCESL